MIFDLTPAILFQHLVWPLIRLIGFIAFGLLVATFIESLNWTRQMAYLARPLIRFGRLSETVGASFAMALFSGVAANTMLAEAYDKKTISKHELIIANLFNSLPTYFLHLPTIFFITAPLIKGAAVVYVGLTFGAAILRTLTIVLLGRVLLPKRGTAGTAVQLAKEEKTDLTKVLRKSGKRFRKRMGKIVCFTVPIYIVIFIMHRTGIFTAMETWMATHLAFLPWLSPQSMGIISLHIAAELTAGLAAAGALLQEGSMTHREIILALLVGNILSSPVRAIRHQFPYYAGIFQPKMASQLIIYNQAFRVISLMIMGTVYGLLTASS